MFRRLFRSRRARRSLTDPEMSSGINTLSDFNSSEDDDDDSEGEEEEGETLTVSDVEDHHGPTIVTMDDGLGGIKHVRMERPPDTQSENEVVPSQDKQRPTAGLGDMIKAEFKGRSLFSVEPTYEKLRKRIVAKNGHVHVERSHVSDRRKRYLSDFFNTMLDLKWRYVLLIFSSSFFGSWFVFAWVWFLIAQFRGDFEPDHLPDRQEASGWQPCVYQIYNFSSCFLFSIETQHTIGYGSRYTSERCPEAVFVMSFQSVVGVMIQGNGVQFLYFSIFKTTLSPSLKACMVGTIFAKLSRPKKRAQTLMFSRNAVVSSREGYLCLQFRVGNMRMSHLVESHARAILINKRVTSEGEVIPYYQTDLKVGTDIEGQNEDVFFIWPMTIVHRIDEDSPFYHMSARDFIKKRFEIIVVLEGIVEPTGMSIQARSSYLPSEILWGYRFKNVLSYRESTNSYVVDYSSFNSVYKVKTPKSSAKQLGEEKKTSTAPPAVTPRKESNWSLSSGTSPRSAAGLVARYKLQANHLSVPCLPQYRNLGWPQQSPGSSNNGEVKPQAKKEIERFF